MQHHCKRILRLGWIPAKLSSPPAAAPASPAPSSFLWRVFLSFSLDICFAVRWRSSFSFLFLVSILDWRYSDFPPPPALKHQLASIPHIHALQYSRERIVTYVSSTLILRGGYFPSLNVEWWYNFRQVFMRSKFSNSMNAKPRHFVGLSFSVATRIETGGFLTKCSLMDSLFAE